MLNGIAIWFVVSGVFGLAVGYVLNTKRWVPRINDPA
jgi:hypothetical protein